MTAALIIAATPRLQAQTASQVGQVLHQTAKSWQSTQVNEAEEQQIGADVSAKLREKYGVVQDAAVHKYVSLVGQSLAQASSRPALRWTFIVLDTDGVNAFAAPGGYVHITRGALAII
jgi:predicted Zn-dependent protease